MLFESEDLQLWAFVPLQMSVSKYNTLIPSRSVRKRITARLNNVTK